MKFELTLFSHRETEEIYESVDVSGENHAQRYEGLKKYTCFFIALVFSRLNTWKLGTWFIRDSRGR